MAHIIKILSCILLLSGCAFSYPRDQIGFFDQCIQATAWGINYISPYGPVTLGYIQYERSHGDHCKGATPEPMPSVP
jgi:hypothetical protein